MEKKNLKEKIEDKLIEIAKDYEKKLSVSKNEINKKFTYRPSINRETEYFSKLKRDKRESNLKSIINSKKLIDSKNPIYKTENNSKENKSNKIYQKKGNNEKNDNKILQKIINQNKFKNSKIISRKEPTLNINPNNLFDYLYFEFEILQKKRKKAIKENMALNYPFKPTINKSYENLNRTNEENVFKRLNKININFIKSKTINKKNKLFDSKIKSDLYNSLTNKNDFNSKIGRNQVNPHKRNLSSENPNSYNNIVNENIKIGKINKHNFENINKKKFLQKSNNIIVNAKYIKYKELFNLLDSDEDGLISYKKIKLSELDFQKLIFLTPILKELQYKRIEMDLNIFIDRIEKCKILNLFLN